MLPMVGLVMELASQASKRPPPKEVSESSSALGGWVQGLRKTRARSNSRSNKGGFLGTLGGLKRANSQQFPLTSAQGDEAGIVMTPSDVRLLQRDRSMDPSELGQEEQGSSAPSPQRHAYHTATGRSSSHGVQDEDERSKEAQSYHKHPSGLTQHSYNEQVSTSTHHNTDTAQPP
jgi:hypothetical protein